MSAQEVNEIAESPRGVTISPTEPNKQSSEAAETAPTPQPDELTHQVKGTDQSIASVTNEGKVGFEKPGQKN